MEDPKMSDEEIILNVHNLLFRITSYGKVLKFIKKSNDKLVTITSKLIQGKFGIVRSTASQYLTALERYGLIERERHGINKTIKITEFGESFIPELN